MLTALLVSIRFAVPVARLSAGSAHLCGTVDIPYATIRSRAGQSAAVDHMAVPLARLERRHGER